MFGVINDNQTIMKSMKTQSVYFLTLYLSLFTIVLSCSKQESYVAVSQEPDTRMATYQTDQYVWEKMARSFQVKTQEPTNLNWEFWSTTEHAYSNPCDAVSWPLDIVDLSEATPKRVAILDGINNHPGNFITTDFAFLTLNFTAPYYEELRINKPMFEYIQKMGLYNQDKVYEMAKANRIDFPSEAMMIKAQWLPVDQLEEQGKNIDEYYQKVISGYDAVDSTVTGKTNMGLVAFHLVTHELPNWVWATFEHSSNIGLCDYIGCKDAFGCTPSYIPSHKEVNKGYTIGETTPELKALFEEFGVPSVFENYRLKGSQTEYTNTIGDTLLLGNSILEANLVTSSSCISCHARATVNNIKDSDGQRANLGMFIIDSINNRIDIRNTIQFQTASDTTTLGFHPVTYSGTPIPEDYLTNASDPDSTYYQTDFMWQLAQHAKPCTNDE